MSRNFESRRLNDRVKFLEPVVTRSAIGTQETTWRGAIVDTEGTEQQTWADVQTASGSRMMQNGDIELIDDIVVNVRCNRNISERWRIVWQGRTYVIIAPPVHDRELWSTRISARRLPDE